MPPGISYQPILNFIVSIYRKNGEAVFIITINKLMTSPAHVMKMLHGISCEIDALIWRKMAVIRLI